VSLQGAIHLVTGPDTQQPPCLRYGELPGTDAFQSDRLQCSVGHGARIGAELTGKIVGDFQLNLHGASLILSAGLLLKR